MKTSNEIRAKIMQWEGCRLTAYRCPAGVLTIGYGHTGPDVTEGKTITAVEAVRIFNNDIDAFSAMVEKQLEGVSLNQYQFDAIVSLAYNIGIGNLRSSSVLKLVKADAGNPAIRGAFMKWTKARVKGVLKELPGLVRRRTEEANHYFKKMPAK